MFWNVISAIASIGIISVNYIVPSSEPAIIESIERDPITNSIVEESSISLDEWLEDFSEGVEEGWDTYLKNKKEIEDALIESKDEAYLDKDRDLYSEHQTEYTDAVAPDKVSYLLTESQYEQYVEGNTIELGRPDGQFCIDSDDMDELLQNSYDEDGWLDVNHINKELGTYLDEEERLIRIDVENPNNIREPSGEESGVNDQHIKGAGITPGGWKEYVIDTHDNAEYFENGKITTISSHLEVEEDEGMNW